MSAGMGDPRELLGPAQAFRLFEVACMIAFPFGWLSLLSRTWSSLHAPFFAFLALLFGFLLTDFITGMFHWFFDTWFSPTTPFIGRAFVRTFREHHIDPTAICRHDFIETNGSNIFSGCVLVVLGHCADTFAAASLLFASLFMSATSQIHKWAHSESVPRVVRWLQRARLILTKHGHALHHAAPYDDSYCITSGWLNATFRYTRFFRALERVINTVTGALPRRDDLGDSNDVDGNAHVVVPAAK
jgi:hypothetical protein